MTVAIGIAFAGFMPERHTSLRRMLDALGGEVFVSESKEREHASVWARRLWDWASNQAADRVVLLNDDVFVCPNFRERIQAMHDAVPTYMHALHTPFDQAVTTWQSGGRWLRCYWMTGPGYTGTPDHFADLLRWSDDNPSAWKGQNEDGVGIQWAWDRQRPFWMPIPAPIQHDVSLASSMGYDNHAMRVSTVPWSSPMFEGVQDQLESKDYWTPRDHAPFLENPWFPGAELSRRRKMTRLQGERMVLLCDSCNREPGHVSFGPQEKPRVRMCRECLARACSALIMQGGA